MALPPAPLTRRRILAHAERDFPERPASPPPLGLSADKVFWNAINEHGMPYSTTADLNLMRALFEEVGEAAMIMGAKENYLGRKRTAAAVSLPNAEEMRALAAEVAYLDRMAQHSTEAAARNRPTRRRRAQPASPPPLSDLHKLHQQDLAARTIQRSAARRNAARQAARSRPARWSSAATAESAGAEAHAPSAADAAAEDSTARVRRQAAWNLLEQCERAASATTVKAGSERKGGESAGGSSVEDELSLRIPHPRSALDFGSVLVGSCTCNEHEQRPQI